MNLPEQFLQQIKDILPQEYLQLVDSLDEAPKVSFRINPNKIDNSTIQSQPVPWCSNGYYLDVRQSFTFDPAFHEGLYYVQDASSMILQNIVTKLTSNNRAVKYLDLCAAPGGKSTAAVDALPQGSLMVSNEIIGSRAQVLKENIIKWGLPNCVVTNNDSSQIGRLIHFFDIIAADVPCSGEGMFRKEEEAVTQWSPALVEQCVARQHEIIDNIWDALRPGGYFIYSTCTYNRDENEKMIDYITSKYEAKSVDIDFDAQWNIHAGIDTNHYCYRFMPHCTDGEGLFVCVLRKSDDEAVDNYCSRLLKRHDKEKKNVAKMVTPNEVKSWILNPKDNTFIVDNDLIVAIKNTHVDALAILRSELRVIHFGTPIATVKGKDFIPAHALAMSVALDASNFNVADVDYLTAIAYLRTEAITLYDQPRGNILISYDNHYLGFVKNLGNRANNLYPREWRIRSGYIPELLPKILK